MIKTTSAFRNLIKPTSRILKTSVFTPLTLFATQIAFKNTQNTYIGLSMNKFYFSSGKPDPQYQNVEKGEFTGPGFYVQQMMTSCLAIYSYYIESGN